MKHVSREELKREREDSEAPKKREKEREKRREKRPSTPPVDTFEGDLSSVSNSSTGSIPNAEVVVVDDHRGKNEIKIQLNCKLICFY